MRLDTLRIGQVLGNILRNGLQQTAAGGEIRVGAALDSGRVVVSVADNGAGIDPAELPHLFDRFYRTDASRSRVTGGRGLGLSITKAIVEAHGGTISIESEGVGRGATVRIFLMVDNR